MAKTEQQRKPEPNFAKMIMPVSDETAKKMIRYLDLDFASSSFRRIKPLAPALIFAFAWAMAYLIWYKLGAAPSFSSESTGGAARLFSTKSIIGIVPGVLFSWSIYLQTFFVYSAMIDRKDKKQSLAKSQG